MGDKQSKAERKREEDKRAPKEVCCEKYLKKGRRCKDCPLDEEKEK